MNVEPTKSSEWKENAARISCTSGHQDMSDSEVGANYSRLFSIVSDANNPHKACLQTPEGSQIT